MALPNRNQYVAVFLLLMACVGGARGAQQEFRVVGEARLDLLFWSVYHSRLYTIDGRYSEGQRPLMLEIEYLMDIDAEDLVAATADEWQHLNYDHPRQGQWLQLLSASWPDIKARDRMTLLINERGDSLFLLNQQLIAKIEDAEFGRHFVDIWLSPKTSRPSLRQALLGGK